MPTVLRLDSDAIKDQKIAAERFEDGFNPLAIAVRASYSGTRLEQLADLIAERVWTRLEKRLQGPT